MIRLQSSKARHYISSIGFGTFRSFGPHKNRDYFSVERHLNLLRATTLSSANRSLGEHIHGEHYVLSFF